MKVPVILVCLALGVIGCGKPAPPAETGRSTAPAMPSPKPQPGAIAEAHGEGENIVSEVVETVSETAQSVAADLREQGELAVSVAQEQARAAVEEAQGQARTMVAEVQVQAQTVVTQLAAQLPQVPAQVLTQAQSHLQTLTSQAADLQALQALGSSNAPARTNLGVSVTETNRPSVELQQAPALSTNRASTTVTNPVVALETNVVNTATNVLQEAQKALDRFLGPKRPASP